MKIRYLGTAAAEGFPAIFCNCVYCKKARELGGKNIRTRSQAIINDDLLIDFPADTYNHFLSNGILGDRIKYLFITHSHLDHLHPDDFEMRHGNYAHDMSVPILQVYCSKGAYNKINSTIEKLNGFELNLIKAYDKIILDGYEVIALPARHYAGDEALFYIIKGDKTVLYAHDTGFFYEEVFEYFEKERIYFDFISLDCTYGPLCVADDKGHMGIENIQRLTKRLYSINAIDDNTVKYMNHFSHNANPIQDELEKLVADTDFNISYDGEKIVI